MKTQKELIAKAASNFVKIVAMHGAESEFATMAFFKLQAFKAGLQPSEAYEWATSEFNRLQDIFVELA